jgi:hypothetical protein
MEFSGDDKIKTHLEALDDRIRKIVDDHIDTAINYMVVSLYYDGGFNYDFIIRVIRVATGRVFAIDAIKKRIQKFGGKRKEESLERFRRELEKAESKKGTR